MNKNQESKDFLFKIILILLGVTIISGVIVWLLNDSNSAPTAKNQETNCSGVDGTNGIYVQKDNRSLGEEVLVKSENNEAKVAGSKAFEQCEFEDAIASFQAWRKIYPREPEVFIYLNNAKVAQAKKPTLKIVVSVPIGRNLGIAQEILRGVAQAQKEVNEGDGINGKLLLVEIANDNNDDALVRELAEEFIKDETIKAVVGHNSTKASQAAAPIYEEEKLVMVSPTSGASDFFKQSLDYVFRTVPPARVYAAALANRIYYYENNGSYLEKIAICYDSEDPYSQSFKNDFTSQISQLNSENPTESEAKVFDTDCNLSIELPNPKQIIQNIQNKGADSLLLVASVSQIEKALEVARANKEEKNLPLFGSTSMYTGKTANKGNDLEGLVLAIPWHPDEFPDNPFPSNAVLLWEAPVNWRTALAYDATKVIIEGLKKSESETRESLQKALKEPNFSVRGATGTVKFDEEGDRQEKPQVLVILKRNSNSQSGTGYDFELLPPPQQ